MPSKSPEEAAVRAASVVMTCFRAGKKLGQAATAVDKVDYACRKHDAHHASSNLRGGNGNGTPLC